MKFDWKLCEEHPFPLGQYGPYVIKYMKGKKIKIEILNYVDSLVSNEEDLMFESFGTIEPTIINRKYILGYVYLKE